MTCSRSHCTQEAEIEIKAYLSGSTVLILSGCLHNCWFYSPGSRITDRLFFWMTSIREMRMNAYTILGTARCGALLHMHRILWLLPWPEAEDSVQSLSGSRFHGYHQLLSPSWFPGHFHAYYPTDALPTLGKKMLSILFYRWRHRTPRLERVVKWCAWAEQISGGWDRILESGFRGLNPKLILLAFFPRPFLPLSVLLLPIPVLLGEYFRMVRPQ